MMRGAMPLMSVRNLRTTFETPAGPLRAVDGVDLEIRPGEVVCLVGESGSGKSVTGLSLMRLIDPPGRIEADVLRLEDDDLLDLPDALMDGLRGRKVGMIFQEPLTALNPSRRVGDQIAEVLRIHGLAARREAADRAVALLARVGIADAAERARAYPHQLSGGQRQRVTIAIACIADPKLIIADEPTTALDVTVQAQILDLLIQMQRGMGSALLFITHDLGVVATIADRVAVMYAGQIVEDGPADDIFGSPRHPYTIGLLASVPDVDAPRRPGAPLPAIAGAVPNLQALEPGCRFRGRCSQSREQCSTEPMLAGVPGERRVRCWLHAGG